MVVDRGCGWREGGGRTWVLCTTLEATMGLIWSSRSSAVAIVEAAALGAVMETDDARRGASKAACCLLR